jgi:tetrahydromethanopterin S-methyltransferase subunit G
MWTIYKKLCDEFAALNDRLDDIEAKIDEIPTE